jgi:hypothetical protein
MGIEPTSPAWEAGALPLCYARVKLLLHSRRFAKQIKPKLAPSHFRIVRAGFRQNEPAGLAALRP